jgi:hypothetical protein
LFNFFQSEADCCNLLVQSFAQVLLIGLALNNPRGVIVGKRRPANQRTDRERFKSSQLTGHVRKLNSRSMREILSKKLYLCRLTHLEDTDDPRNTDSIQ